MTNKWHNRFFQLAAHIAEWSKDSTKVGCVLVGTHNEILSTGYNGLPRGIDESADNGTRLRRPTKYSWTEHAERNAIYNAARNGIRLGGSSIYTNWFPCSDCARAIIQCGIVRVVGTMPDNHPKYGEDFNIVIKMLAEANIESIYLNKEMHVG